VGALIDKEVNEVPSYIKAARVLTNRTDLREWLASEVNRKSSDFNELVEALTAEVDYPDFVPANRSLDDLTFY